MSLSSISSVAEEDRDDYSDDGSDCLTGGEGAPAINDLVNGQHISQQQQSPLSGKQQANGGIIYVA